MRATTAPDTPTAASVAAKLAAAEHAGLRRPWELIFDRAPARDFKTGKTLDGVTAPVASSFRIVDADRRLIVRIAADPEQALTIADMQLIVEAVNAA